MLSPENRTIAQAFKAKLHETGIIPLELRVFGSRARGDHEEFSDLDVLIVLGEVTDQLKDAVYDCAWEVGFDNDLLIAPRAL